MGKNTVTLSKLGLVAKTESGDMFRTWLSSSYDWTRKKNYASNDPGSSLDYEVYSGHPAQTLKLSSEKYPTKKKTRKKNPMKPEWNKEMVIIETDWRAIQTMSATHVRKLVCPR